VADEQHKTDAELPRMPSGIPGLDDVLGGGFVRNGIYIVQGLPGAGKTIFGNQVCYAQVAAGERALYITLLSETYDRMLLHIRGMSFFQPQRIAHELNYISAFRVLEQEGLHGLLTLARREIAARRPSVLVIDGLVAAEHLAPSELELKKFVHELQTQAATSDCTMFLLTSAGDATVSPEHTMVDGMIELADQQYQWRSERELNVRKFRGSGYLRGRHSMRIDSEGITVFPRIESLLARPAPGRLPSGERTSAGVPGLDEMLGGGVPRASTTLVLGPTGSGKTTFGLHFLSASERKEPALMVGFYESPDDLAGRAEMLAPELAAKLHDGTVEILWFPEAEDHVDRIALELFANVRRRGVRRLFLDGLHGFRTLTPYRERLPSFVRALCNELRALDVTALFTMEVTELVGSVVRAPASALTPIAENLVLLRYLELGSELQRLISVLKVREGQFDPRLRGFEIEAGRIVIGGPFRGMERLLTGFPHPVAEDGDALSPSDPGRGSGRHRGT
jgi:circadian clock protein KaiC